MKSPILRWCGNCSQAVVPMDDGRCSWCDGPTREKRGGGRKRGQSRKLTNHQIHALHVAHLRGQSINSLAAQVWERAGYASQATACNAICKAFKQLGLPARDRIEVVKQVCTIHGLAPKHGPRPGYGTYRRRLHRSDQPRCAAVKSRPPGKGRPCSRPAMFGSDFCFQHDPATRDRSRRIMKAARDRQPERVMLPMLPFAAWLNTLRSGHGTMRQVAELTGLPYTAACRYVRGRGTDNQPKARVSLDLVERATAAAGCSVETVYGHDRLAVAA